MRNKSYRLIIFILYLFISCLCIRNIAYAKDLECNIKCAYDEITTGKNTNFFINIKSKNGIEGTLLFVLQDDKGSEYTYKIPLSIKKGGKYSSEKYIYIPQNTKEVTTKILNNNNENLYNEKLDILNESNISYLKIGILSDTPSVLSYLNDISMNYSLLKSKTVVFNTKSFPNNQMALEQIDMMVISNYNLKNLDQKQFKALNNWVINGGILVLGTGSRVGDMLGRYAPELLEDMYKTPIVLNIFPASNFDGVDNETILTIPVTSIKLKGGNIISYDKIPLISEVKKENGKIIVCAYDLCELRDYAISNTQFIKQLIYKLFGDDKISNLVDNNKFDDTNWEIKEITSNGEWQNVVSIKFYIICLILYIIIIGPILYIVLKKRNSLIFYLTTVPIIAVLFSVFIYTIGATNRFVDTIYNYASIYEVEYNEINENTYMDIKNANNKTYSVNLNGSYYITPLDNINSEDYVANKIVIDEDKKYTKVTFKNAPTFKSYYLKMNKNLDNNMGIEIDGKIRMDKNGLHGTIVNSSNIKFNNAILVCYGKIVLLGDIESKQSVELDKKPVHIIPMNNYYNIAKYVYDDKKSINKEYEDYVRVSNKTYLLAFYLKHFLNEYTQEAKLLSTVDNINSDELVNDNIIGNGYNLLSIRLKIDDKINNHIYRSINMLKPKVLSGDYDSKFNSIYAGGTTILQYNLGSDINVDKIEIEKFFDKFYTYNKNLKIYLFNLKTDEYDEINYEDFVLSKDALGKYLNSRNEIIIRYSSTNTEDNYVGTALPFISVSGTSVD